jgi:hypothetical protein
MQKKFSLPESPKIELAGEGWQECIAMKNGTGDRLV